MAEKPKSAMLLRKADSVIAAIIGKSPLPSPAASAMQGRIAAAPTIHGPRRAVLMIASRPARICLARCASATWTMSSGSPDAFAGASTTGFMTAPFAEQDLPDRLQRPRNGLAGLPALAAFVPQNPGLRQWPGSH